MRNSSWLSLITFCSVAALAAALAAALLFAGATLAFAVGQSGDQGAGAGSAPSSPTLREFSGVIADSNCGARHMANRGPAECVQACLRNGSKYVLVNGDKRYVLSGNEADFQRFAGQRVTATGTLADDTLTVNSVSGTQ